MWSDVRDDGTGILQQLGTVLEVMQFLSLLSERSRIC